MYLIIDSTDRIAEVCEHPAYVRRQKNGVVILSDEICADAIYSNDSNKFFPTERVSYLCEKHTLLEVESVPSEVTAGFWFYHAGEYYTTEAELAALAKSRAADTAGIVFVKMAETEQLDDVTIAEHPEQFLAWAKDVEYAAGEIRSHGGALYRCLNAHTSQESWTPDAAPSLWKKVGDPTAEWPEWSQPIGATDTYAAGDKVAHNGKYWVSDIDANVWEPGVYGWTEAEAE